MRWQLGYKPARWQIEAHDRRLGTSSVACVAARVLTVGLAVLTCAILGYCLIGALNARAVYNPVSMEFAY